MRINLMSKKSSRKGQQSKNGLVLPRMAMAASAFVAAFALAGCSSMEEKPEPIKIPKTPDWVGISTPTMASGCAYYINSMDDLIASSILRAKTNLVSNKNSIVRSHLTVETMSSISSSDQKVIENLEELAQGYFDNVRVLKRWYEPNTRMLCVLLKVDPEGEGDE